jgi:hypothetical protein
VGIGVGRGSGTVKTYRFLENKAPDP